MKFSIIIPVYNRPEEVKELLATLARQSFRDFEVLVVEDGSSIPCHQEVEAFSEVFPLRYFVKENGGPAQARNYAAERAQGEYLIILDSQSSIQIYALPFSNTLTLHIISISKSLLLNLFSSAHIIFS